MKITATFLQLGANYAILLNQSNFSTFKFSNVSYCFEIKAIKHKISMVFTVTCVDVFVQIEQSSRTYYLAQKRSIRFRGTQREYSSKPLKHSIVKRILVFKR